MAVAAIRIKLMPDSPDTDLDKVKQAIEEKIRELDSILNSIDEEPIAFGLKALIVTVAWKEEKDTSILEDAMRNIEGISNVDIVDYRRAFG